MTPHKYNWNDSSSNRFLFAILLLTSSVEIFADNVHLMEGGSSQENNCTIYRSCTQCTDASICSWLVDKQICYYTDQSISGNFIAKTKEFCPDFAVTYDNHHSIRVTVSNIGVKSVSNFFNEIRNISCEIENATYKASIDNGVITCKWVEKKTMPPEEQSTTKTNPLFIFYFSIVVNGVRLQFNDPRDHYISHHGWTCPNENCTIRYWESDSRKYYCKWCSKDDGCKITGEQLNSCDVRNAINNEKWKDESSLSAMEIRSSAAAIESFEPVAMLYRRKTPVVISITVKNLHWILAVGRLTTVTVAGESCTDPTTVDGQTVNCTISTDNEADKEGLVVIEYEWLTSVVSLKSVQKFGFVRPLFTGVSPMCVPASGGTRIELTGENLNATADVQVFFNKTTTKVMCEIVELARDHIDCVTNAKTDGSKEGPLQISFESWVGRFLKNKKFKYVDDPFVSDGQVFEGIASGVVPLTVRGGFECTENQQMYVDYNDTKYYGHCELSNTANGTATMMDCWPPKLDDPVQVTCLPFGFRTDLAGKVVFLPQQTCYMLHPDPVYTDFEVYDGTVVRVDGVFPDLLQRRQLDGSYMLEVTFLVDEVGDDERLTVTNVTGNFIECRAPSDKSVADVLEIAIAVGKQVKRTVVHRRHKQYYAIVRLLSPQYVVGGISSLLICVFALIFCVKKIMSYSKQHLDKRYLGELRNITAGIDDTTDYLLNSNTGKKPKTRH